MNFQLIRNQIQSLLMSTEMCTECYIYVDIELTELYVVVFFSLSLFPRNLFHLLWNRAGLKSLVWIIYHPVSYLMSCLFIIINWTRFAFKNQLTDSFFYLVKKQNALMIEIRCAKFMKLLLLVLFFLSWIAREKVSQSLVSNQFHQHICVIQSPVVNILS